MKHAVALSLTLIACSAGAGFGLSYLHDYSLNEEAVALTTPVATEAASGFALPQYVPAAVPALATAPARPAPVAPAEAAPVLATAPADSLDVTRPQLRSDRVAALPSVTEMPTAEVNALIQATPRVTRSVQPTQAPVQRFTAQTAPRVPAQGKPEYVVGVYR